MKMKFRKKPVVIEAMLLNDDNLPKIWDWMGDAYLGHGESEGVTDLKISTLEGVMTANVGDWIIKGVKGEFYPCKPDIFALTYELAEVTT